MNLAEKNEKIISKSIAQIKDNAEELVRRFEEEKEKNVFSILVRKSCSFW